MTVFNRQVRVVLIAIAATVCAVGLVRAEAQGSVDTGQPQPTVTTSDAR